MLNEGSGLSSYSLCVAYKVIAVLSPKKFDCCDPLACRFLIPSPGTLKYLLPHMKEHNMPFVLSDLMICIRKAYL